MPEVTQKTGVMVDEVTRGLGWVIASQAGPNGDLTSKDTIHHTGFTGTSIWIDRQNEIGFVYWQIEFIQLVLIFHIWTQEEEFLIL